MAVAVGLAAAFTSHGAQAADANVTGAWAVEGRIEAAAGVAVARPDCAFQQTGAELTGSCKGPNAHGPAKGKVEGQKVSFRWETTSDTALGLTGSATFEGVLGADGVIRGAWSIAQLPGASGEFTAQRR
jgi:hypothetical protein